MKHDLNLTLKMYKVVFSDKQIPEIKKKMHIDPIFTYSDSEIAFKDSDSTVHPCVRLEILILNLHNLGHPNTLMGFLTSTLLINIAYS